MPRWLVFAALTAVALLLSGCGGGGGVGCEVTGSGAKETKTIKLPSYTKLEVGTGIAADVSIGTVASFSIELYSNVADYLDVKVVSDTLQIRMKPHVCNHGARATVVVTEALQSLTASGGSPVTIDKLNGPLDASGGSSVDVSDTLSNSDTFSDVFISSSGGSEVTVQKLTSVGDASIDTSDGGPVSVKEGSAKSTHVSASDGSDVKLGNFQASTGVFSANGGSSVDGMVLDTLSLSLSGGSDVETFVKTKAGGTCSGGGSVTIVGGADTSGISTSGGCTLSDPEKAASLVEVAV